MTDRTEYKNKYKKANYDRLDIILPKGYKSLINKKAKENNLSISSYIKLLIEKDYQSIFDRMQISDKNRKFIKTIKGNFKEGYTIEFVNGYTAQCKNKKNAREYISKYCKKTF